MCLLLSFTNTSSAPYFLLQIHSLRLKVHRFALHQHIRVPSSRSRSIQNASVLLHFVIFHMCRIQGRAMIFDSTLPDGGVTERVCKKPPARIALGFPHTFTCMTASRQIETGTFVGELDCLCHPLHAMASWTGYSLVVAAWCDSSSITRRAACGAYLNHVPTANLKFFV